jgi:hypothetical protein
MRPIIPWRSRAAVWLLIPGLLGIVAYSAQFADETTVAGCWPAAMAGSAIYLSSRAASRPRPALGKGDASGRRRP